jgi:hypothetical protein
MATYQSSKKSKKNKKAQPDRSVFGSYVAPIFSNIAGQFNRRGTLFTGKNNTQTGRYSN